MVVEAGAEALAGMTVGDGQINSPASYDRPGTPFEQRMLHKRLAKESESRGVEDGERVVGKGRDGVNHKN